METRNILQNMLSEYDWKNTEISMLKQEILRLRTFIIQLYAWDIDISQWGWDCSYKEYEQKIRIEADKIIHRETQELIKKRHIKNTYRLHNLFN